MGSNAALIQQLHSDSPSKQLEAITALSVLPLTPQNWQSAVIAIPRLVQLLHSASTSSPHSQAIQRLIHLISNYHEGSANDVASVFPHLVSLLRDDDADVHQVAVLTLTTLVMKAENIHKTLEAGAIAPLIQLLKSSSEDTQFAASGVLLILSCGNDAVQAMRGSLPPAPSTPSS